MCRVPGLTMIVYLGSALLATVVSTTRDECDRNEILLIAIQTLAPHAVSAPSHSKDLDR